MTTIAVGVPPSLQKYRGHLRMFLEGMVRKLDLNSHKDTPTRPSVETLLSLMIGEKEELEEQLKNDKWDPNSLTETYDISNYAFLIFMALRNEGTLSDTEQFIIEHLDIRPKIGKVFCKKTRAGSKYRIGDEIKGGNHNGYVYIKMQGSRHRTGARKVSVARSHLIWWKATGKWPTGVVDHKNHKRNDDRIVNLRDLSFSDNNLNKKKNNKYPPFVTRYMPTGRQHLSHYGKYVYARSFRGILVRAAYYDTPRQAAIIGAEEWKKITEGLK